ncbi:MAG: tetratricopeptide repeat protein, partial [Alphaproteobacteria bacterium]
MRHAFIKWLSIALAVSAPIATDRNGYAETPSIVSPPRTISDIAAILDQERPNPEQLTALRVAAAATPPQSASDREVARFYFRRAQARFALNRIPEAIADTENALARLTDKVSREAFTIQQFLAVLYRSDSLRALRLLREMEHAFSRRGTTAQRLSIYRHTVGHLTFLGDLQHAELYLRKSIALFGESVARGDTATELYRSSWEADLELTRAILLEARGQFMDAEAALAKSLTMRRDSLAKSAKWPTSPPKSGFQQVIDQTIQSLGRVKALDGRLVEAEAKMRRALLNRLKLVGKYHNTTAFAVRQLARAINAQGRYGEAEKLLRSAVEIYESVGVAETSQAFLRLKLELAETLTAQGRWNDALRIFGAIDKGLEAWPPARRVTFQLRLSRIHALYRTGGAETGLKLAEALVARERSRVGENHYDYAMALAAMAVGLGQSGRDAEALAAFRLAVPILTLASREGSDEAGPAASKRDHQVRLVVEPYMALLARTANNTDGAAAAVESLGLADAIRGRSVQTALAAASARMATKDSALAELIRQEQDLRKRIGARFTLLNDVLALPPAQRDETAVAELRGTITLLRAQHVAARHDIGQRFPDYADLIDPKPPSIAEIQRALRSDETVLSFYFGLDHSFVWAVPKTGAPTFFMIPANAGAIEAKIKMLRKALEPDVSTVEDIPQFDLALAHELYSPLLKPLEATWKPAK